MTNHSNIVVVKKHTQKEVVSIPTRGNIKEEENKKCLEKLLKKIGWGEPGLQTVQSTESCDHQTERVAQADLKNNLRNKFKDLCAEES